MFRRDKRQKRTPLHVICSIHGIITISIVAALFNAEQVAIHAHHPLTAFPSNPALSKSPAPTSDHGLALYI
jgi:hypothetical protein